MHSFGIIVVKSNKYKATAHTEKSDELSYGLKTGEEEERTRGNKKFTACLTLDLAEEFCTAHARTHKHTRHTVLQCN